MKTRPQGIGLPLIGFVPSKAPVIMLLKLTVSTSTPRSHRSLYLLAQVLKSRLDRELGVENVVGGRRRSFRAALVM